MQRSLQIALQRSLQIALQRFAGDLSSAWRRCGAFLEISVWRREIPRDLPIVLEIAVLVPHVKKRGYGKVIPLSFGGATQPMPPLST